MKRLLQECGLPVAGITQKHLEHFFMTDDGSGVVGHELYETVALIRSLAVLPKCRNTGLAADLALPKDIVIPMTK